jgi:hypothetical protein
MVQETVNFRENNNIKRNDFMQLLIQLKNRCKVEEKHSFVEEDDDGNLNNKSGDNGISNSSSISHFAPLQIYLCRFQSANNIDIFTLG